MGWSELRACARPPSETRPCLFPVVARELAQLLHCASAGELIPEQARQGLQALIEAEAAAALGADRHQRTVHVAALGCESGISKPG